MKTIFDTILEDDWTRVKMGRFSDADEKMITSILNQKAGSSLFVRIMGGGADMSRPALSSARPKTANGERPFHFGMTSHTNRKTQKIPAGQVYFHAPQRSANAAGAKWHKTVVADGQPGVWSLPAGSALPDGALPPSTLRGAVRGLAPGQAAAAHRYIERLDRQDADKREEVEFSAGSLATEESAFWDHVEIMEGSGRVQYRIKAELPYQAQIGPSGRQRIVEQFGALFDELKLPWRAAVHRPGEGGDPRNHHLHVLFYDRESARAPAGFWCFGKKSQACRPRTFVNRLRTHFAQVVNRELKRAGIREIWHPGGYEALGIDKQPGRHLGPSQMARERAGLVTDRGTHNIGCVREWRYRRVVSRIDQVRFRDVAFAEEALAFARRSVASTVSPAVHAGVSALLQKIPKYLEQSRRRWNHSCRAQLLQERARELPRRADLVARHSNDVAIAGVARDVASEVRKRVVGSKRFAMDALGVSRADYRDSRGQIEHLLAQIRAEMMLAERARTVADIQVMELSFRRDDRLSERAWSDQRQAIEMQIAQGRLGFDRALEKHRKILEHQAPADSIDALMEEVANPRLRKTLSLHHKFNLVSADQSGPVAQSIEAIRRATMQTAKAERDRLKHKAREISSRSDFVIDAAEAETRNQAMREIKNKLVMLDRRIKQDPIAAALAQSRGISLAYETRAQKSRSRSRLR